jgi:hypothetical protein
VDDIFGQRDHAVRFDWGLPGALATDADVCVVVDVLSFSTSVTIAVERGMRVFPFAWKDEPRRTPRGSPPRSPSRSPSAGSRRRTRRLSRHRRCHRPG